MTADFVDSLSEEQARKLLKRLIEELNMLEEEGSFEPIDAKGWLHYFDLV